MSNWVRKTASLTDAPVMVADTIEKNMKKSKAAGFRSLDLMLIIAMKGDEKLI